MKHGLIDCSNYDGILPCRLKGLPRWSGCLCNLGSFSKSLNFVSLHASGGALLHSRLTILGYMLVPLMFMYWAFNMETFKG
ncbi:unnamed protein product [Prunus brigantina]